MSKEAAKKTRPVKDAKATARGPGIKDILKPDSERAVKIFGNKETAAKFIDGFDNFISRVGLNNANTLSGGVYTFNLITKNRIQLEAAYRGSWIVGQVIDTVAEDMTRAGIEIITNESKEDIKDLQSSISRFKIWESLRENTQWGRLYGGCVALIQIKGQALDQPLDYETVGKDQFQGLVPFDRWQVWPELDQYIEEGPDMGLPKFYQITPSAQNSFDNPKVSGMLVHHSRLIRSIGIKLPYWQAVTEQMWGESVLERMWDRLIAFDNVTMSAASLVDRANLRTVGIDGLREIIAAGGQAQVALQKFFEMMRTFQTNEGLTLLDKNDEFKSDSYTFAGLADMILQFGQQLSGSAKIPLVRLFGQSPSGLNATGDADIRLYYDSIRAAQESQYRPGMEVILRVLWRSIYGKEAPKDLEFTFVPLWQMSAMDKANVAKTTAETVSGLYTDGIITRAAAMKDLRQMSREVGVFSNITDEEIEVAEDEPPLPSETDTETENAPGATETPKGESQGKEVTETVVEER